MKKKLIRQIIAGILITGVVVYFTGKAIGSLNPYQLLSADINWGLAAVSVIIFIFSVFIRALVYSFGIDRRIGIMESFRIVAVGNMANMVLPIRAGEILRLSLFPHNFSASKRSWLVVIPAAIDMLVIFAISELALPVSGFSNPTIVSVLHVVAGVYLAIIMILLTLLFLIPRFKMTAQLFVKGSVFKMSVWVFCSWVIMLASIIVGLLAYGYNAYDSIKMSFAIFAATNVVMLLPSTPGGIGLFEYGVVLGLEGFGITKFPAKEIGMLLHLIQYAALLPLGAWLYFHGFKHRPAGGTAEKHRGFKAVMYKKIKLR